MKIYFAASIRGGRADVEIYRQLIEHLKKQHQVLTEHIGDYSLSDKGEKQLPDQKIYQRDMDWLKQCDVVVAETSNPSLGVGYELANAQFYNKPVLILHNRSTQLSAMINGCDYYQDVFYYQDIDQAKKFLDDKLN